MNQPTTTTTIVGIVKQVLSGDTIVVRDRPLDGPPPERTITISNINCGRLARKPNPANPEGVVEDAFAWEAREFTRRRLIGKEVCCVIESESQFGKKYGNIYLGKTTSGENFALSLVKEGLAEVRRLVSAAAEKNTVYQQLVLAQEEAKGAGKGRWSSEQHPTRNVIWAVDDPKTFLEKYKGHPLKSVVEHVRDGSSMQVVILPESLSEEPNTFINIPVVLSGIKAPTIRAGDKQTNPEALALDALFFVESRLLQREVTVLLESVLNQSFVASVLHPNGNIAKLLLRNGLARCVDWNLSLVSVPGASESYKLEERYAKEHRLRLWKDYQAPAAVETQQPHDPNRITAGMAFTGQISEVGNGDNVSVKCSDGVVRKFFLASIRSPKPASTVKDGEENPQSQRRLRPLYDVPYVFEAREFLRKFVHKPVKVYVDYIQPKTATIMDERVCTTVTCDGTNLAVELVSRGLASVIRYRNANDARTQAYGELIAAEEKAQSNGLGIHSKQESAALRVVDITGNLAKSRQYLTFLQRAERLDGIVEFVTSASRFRVYIPRQNCIINLLVSGVQCPRKGRTLPDGTTEPDTPFCDEAIAFAKDLCLQRDVEVKVETIDRVGNYVGWIFVESLSDNGHGNDNTAKQQGKKKKKKGTDVVVSKAKLNVSIALVSQGFGTVHRAPATERSAYYHDLLKAEVEAKQSRIGVWSSDEFVKQWESQLDVDIGDGDGADGNGYAFESKLPEYVDDLSSLNLNSQGNVTNSHQMDAPKLLWKAAQITAIGKYAGNNQGLRFFAQHLSNAATIVQISNTLNSQPLPSFAPGYQLKKGELCAACYSLDNYWYRARVIRSSPKAITIQFIDFGNEETIDAAEMSSRVSPLPSGQLMSLAPQATEYRLAFVQLSPDASYRALAEQVFREHVENKEVRLAVQFDSIPCANETLKAVPAVSLIVNLTDPTVSTSSGRNGEVDVGILLLAEGLVCVEPMPASLIKRLSPQQVQRYLDAQATAKRERKNIWRYGDFRADDDL